MYRIDQTIRVRVPEEMSPTQSIATKGPLKGFSEQIRQTHNEKNLELNVTTFGAVSFEKVVKFSSKFFYLIRKNAIYMEIITPGLQQHNKNQIQLKKFLQLFNRVQSSFRNHIIEFVCLHKLITADRFYRLRF